VCERERERETEMDRETETDRETERQREKERERQRELEREIELPGLRIVRIGNWVAMDRDREDFGGTGLG
jgi:hypothetical protein